MNLKQSIKQKRKEYPKRMPTLVRIKWGRRICVWAGIPCNFSFWMMPIGVAMQTKVKPTVWAKGRLNERRGNGDLLL